MAMSTAGKAITIYTPATEDGHIYAEDDAQIYRAIFGGNGSGIAGADNMLAATVPDNNTVTLDSGTFFNMGYALVIPCGETLNLSIGSGTQGKYRVDQIVATFRRGGGDTPDTHIFEVLTGTESDSLEAARQNKATLTQEDIRAGGAVRQEVLYNVIVSGITISTVERVTPYIGSFYA